MRLAAGVLALVCVFWGFSFPVMQMCTAEVRRHGPADLSPAALSAAFNGVRFAAAALVYVLLVRPRAGAFTRGEVAGGTVVGMFFAGGMLLQVMGLRWTLPSVSGFLTSLAVIFAPLAQAILFRRPVRMLTWVAVATAVAGILLLSRPNPGSAASNTLAQAPPAAHLGEVLTVLASMMFTGQILSLDHFGAKADTTRLTVVMLAATGVVSLVGGVAMGAGPLFRGEVVGAIARSPTFWWTMGGLVLVSSVVALHLMNRYQPLVAPATAAVIYCLEPPFATAFSVLFRTESVTRWTAAGGITVLVAVLIVTRGAK